MANAVWPVSLPQRVRVEGYSEQPANTRIDTPTESGIPKSRNRFTVGVEPIEAVIEVDFAQKATLDAFYNATLANGALPFDWVRPVEGTPAVFKFRAPPKFTARRRNKLAVALSLWIVPS